VKAFGLLETDCLCGSPADNFSFAKWNDETFFRTQLFESNESGALTGGYTLLEDVPLLVTVRCPRFRLARSERSLEMRLGSEVASDCRGMQ
jgi:hypothetical protein